MEEGITDQGTPKCGLLSLLARRVLNHDGNLHQGPNAVFGAVRITGIT